MAKAGERIAQLDSVRAVAFLAVFFYHSLHLRPGWLGVDLFFVLSGFLITRNLLELRETTTTGNALSVFFYRRLLRIIPPYYLALAIMLATRPFPAHEATWYFGFASNIRDSIHPVIEGPPVTMWSIAVEEQFYLVWPLFVLLLPVRRLPYVFAAVVAIAIGVRAYYSAGNPDAVYRLTISRMDLLALGALLALKDRASPDWMKRRTVAFAVALAGAVAAYAALSVVDPSFRYFSGDLVYDTAGYALSAAACASVIAIVRANPWRILMNPVSRYVGKISYSAYLIHVVMLEQFHDRGLPGPVTIALALAATLLYATVSWYVFETPLQQRWRHFVRVSDRRSRWQK